MQCGGLSLEDSFGHPVLTTKRYISSVLLSAKCHMPDGHPCGMTGKG